MTHGLMHFAAVTKAHFNFGGMHIDIYACRVHLQIQDIDRLALTMQHIFVGAACAMCDHFVTDKPAIDIGKLLIGASTGSVRRARASSYMHRACSEIDVD